MSNWFVSKAIKQGAVPIDNSIFRSGFEDEVNTYLSSLLPSGEVMFNVRDLIKTPLGRPLEVDIYYPHLDLAVEVNSVHYHSDKSKYRIKGEIIDYHDYKTLSLAKLGITLIHIWDFEWDIVNRTPKPNKEKEIMDRLFKLGILSRI